MEGNMVTLNIQCDDEPLRAALDSLSKLSKEVVQGFLSGLDSGAQLLLVDSEGFATVEASEIRVILQPSDLLHEFLSAMRAGNWNNA